MSAEISDTIDRLHAGAQKLQALSSKAEQGGHAEQAQDLTTQAVLMMAKKANLQAKQRDIETSSPEWQALGGHLDALEHNAEQTKADMQKAQDTVETAKTVISTVGKLLTALL